MKVLFHASILLEVNRGGRRLCVLDYVYSRTNPDGSIHHLMVSGEQMFDQSGRFTGYRGIGKDVTDKMMSNHESA